MATIADEFVLVPGTGLEPVSHAAADFKSAVYTDSTTRARGGFSHSHGALPSFAFDVARCDSFCALLRATGSQC